MGGGGGGGYASAQWTPKVQNSIGHCFLFVFFFFAFDFDILTIQTFRKRFTTQRDQIAKWALLSALPNVLPLLPVMMLYSAVNQLNEISN